MTNVQLRGIEFLCLSEHGLPLPGQHEDAGRIYIHNVLCSKRWKGGYNNTRNFYINTATGTPAGQIARQNSS
jgi:hypothetical protein